MVVIRVGETRFPSAPAIRHDLEIVLSEISSGPKAMSRSGVARIKTDAAVLPELSIPWSMFTRRSGGRAVGGSSASLPAERSSQ